MVGNASTRDRATVAVGTGGSIEDALVSALKESRIEHALRGPRDRGETCAVIKPMLSPSPEPAESPRRYVEPRLAERLARWLRDLGWRVTIAVSGPDGEAAARAVGYKGPVHDLTNDTDTFDYGGSIGRHVVSQMWRDADVRVLVGRALPDPQLVFTGAIATALGSVPDSGRLTRRHVTGSALATCANDLLESLPVTFGVIDAWDRPTHADGPTPHQAILASSDLFGLDWVLGEVAGLEAPQLGFIVAEALQRHGIVDLERWGDLVEWPDWKSPSAVRVVRTDAAAGRWWGRIAGWQEVPWTAR